MNEDLEQALAMIRRLVEIAIRNWPSDDAKRGAFYMDMLRGIKVTAGLAVRSSPLHKPCKPKRKR